MKSLDERLVALLIIDTMLFEKVVVIGMKTNSSLFQKDQNLREER